MKKCERDMKGKDIGRAGEMRGEGGMNKKRLRRNCEQERRESGEGTCGR